MLIDEAHEIDHALELLPLPADYQLSQNYPNPFNPATTIRFSIPARAAAGTRVQLRIFNMLGALVRTLLDEEMFPGHYAVKWDGQNNRGATVSSGIYIYQLLSGESKQTKRMVFVR
jgi:flagellar hook assembly protein FlgD